MKIWTKITIFIL